MVTPLQIDTFTRDLWGNFDPLAIAQLAPLVASACYKPKIYVGLDTLSQSIPANGYASYGLNITPGSLIYGFYMGLPQDPSPWNIQITDTARGKKLWTSPVSQVFLSSNGGGTGEEANYPCLLEAPYPVIGKGVFQVEVWNQLAATQSVVPLIGVMELVEPSMAPSRAIRPNAPIRPPLAPVPIPVLPLTGRPPVPLPVIPGGRPPQWTNLCWALRHGLVDASQFDPQQLMKLQFRCSQLGYAGNCIPPADVLVWLDQHRRAGTLPRINVSDADIAALPQAPDLTGVSCTDSYRLGGMSGYQRR